MSWRELCDMTICTFCGVAQTLKTTQFVIEATHRIEPFVIPLMLSRKTLLPDISAMQVLDRLTESPRKHSAESAYR